MSEEQSSLVVYKMNEFTRYQPLIFHDVYLAIIVANLLQFLYVNFNLSIMSQLKYKP